MVLHLITNSILAKIWKKGEAERNGQSAKTMRASK